ncbi:MAG: alpha/beta hydrolase [Longimicrobiales bacterium]
MTGRSRAGSAGSGVPTPDPELRDVGEQGHTRKRVVTHGVPADEAEAAAILIHGRGGSPEGMLTLAGEKPIEGLAWIAPHADGSTWYPKSFLAPLAENEPWLSSALEWLEEIVADLGEKGIPPDRIGFVGFSQGACLSTEFVARHPRRYGGVAALSGGLVGPPGSDFEERFGLDLEGGSGSSSSGSFPSETFPSGAGVGSEGGSERGSGGRSGRRSGGRSGGQRGERSGGRRGGQRGERRVGPGSLAGTRVFLGCSDVDPHIPEERVHETARILKGLGADVDARIYHGMGHTVNEEELAELGSMVSALVE